MTPTATQPCSMCGGVMVTAAVVAPYAMVVQGATRHMVPAVNVVAISACATCDRPRCPNAGCGMPTGPLLPFATRSITPTVCDHCNRPTVFGGPRG